MNLFCQYKLSLNFRPVNSSVCAKFIYRSVSAFNIWAIYFIEFPNDGNSPRYLVTYRVSLRFFS